MFLPLLPRYEQIPRCLCIDARLAGITGELLPIVRLEKGTATTVEVKISWDVGGGYHL